MKTLSVLKTEGIVLFTAQQCYSANLEQLLHILRRMPSMRFLEKHFMAPKKDVPANMECGNEGRWKNKSLR